MDRIEDLPEVLLVPLDIESLRKMILQRTILSDEMDDLGSLLRGLLLKMLCLAEQRVRQRKQEGGLTGAIAADDLEGMRAGALTAQDLLCDTLRIFGWDITEVLAVIAEDIDGRGELSLHSIW